MGPKEPFVGGETSYAALFEVKENDVVVRTITAYESPVAVARAEHDGAFVSQVFLTYEVSSRLDPEFLMALFRTPGFWAEMQGRAVGSVVRRKTISDAAFRQIPLRLPPLAYQRRVARLMKSATEASNAARASVARQAEALTATRDALFGRLWESGDLVPLGEVLREVKRPVRVEEAQSFNQIGVRSHGRGVFLKEPVTSADLGAKKVYWVEPGDLTINIVFAWEGAVAVIPTEAVGHCASHRFPTYRGVDDGPIEYFKHLLLSRRGLELLQLASPGGAGRNRTLNRKQLMAAPVPFPTISERVDVANAVTSMEAVVSTSAGSLASLDRLVEHLGQLVVHGSIEIPESYDALLDDAMGVSA